SALLLHVMPLDLHVLGLSLAFILSQDQTLRCIFVFCISLENPDSNHERNVVGKTNNTEAPLSRNPRIHDLISFLFLLNGYQS
ncbi:MAG: hypothetical protein WCZ43_12175, partial [Proteiniphilum sp.]